MEKAITHGKKDLRPFIKHCMEDREFWNAVGIPTKECFYIEKLGMNQEQIDKFYECMVGLVRLSKELNKKL